jgi:hypothetical protein
MGHDEFEEIFERTVANMRKTLVEKAAEYATDDRLHNFRVAATLQGINERQALAGMMAKHTVSVYDLLASDDLASQATWDEKVGDHLNYLILLQAIVVDERYYSRKYD